MKLISIIIFICTTYAYSQVQGPNQPEFTNFSSVNNQSLVNEISGDFNYHIPLLTIPGNNGFNYELKMTYNSDISPNDEPSWIGWGWSLNIGSITRMKNGFADDFKDVDVKYFNKKKDNISVNLSTVVDAELISKDIKGNEYLDGGVGLKLNLHYNNQNGYYMSLGGGMTAYRGIGNIDFGFNKTGNLTGSYSYTLSPSHLLSAINDSKVFDEDALASLSEWVSNSDVLNVFTNLNEFAHGGNYYNSMSKRFNSTPVNFPEYTTKVYKGRVTGRFDAFPKVGVDAGLSGNIVVTEYKEVIEKKAYGYFYSDEALNTHNRLFVGVEKIKMDYENSQNNPYEKRDRFLGIPFSNPDEYLVQVEGLSGGFRTHFEKPIIFTPNYQKNESSDISLGTSLNFGTTDFGIGFPLSLKLKGANEIIPYNNSSNVNNKYFSFHNDKALYMLQEDLNLNVQRPKLSKSILEWGFDDSNLDLMTNPSQPVSTFIEYHTIGELIKNVGFNKELKFSAYSNNIDNNHSDLIAEFKITNSDGNTYVFGQPVFSMDEKSISYGLDPKFNHFVENNFFYPKRFEESQATSKTGYEINHPYANSYLVTEIRNSNYYDVSNDGPTLDDVGDFIKFEYSKIAGAINTINGIYLGEGFNKDQWYKWRIPFEGYNYSRGDLANIEDDIISYNEGKKELFYPKSISTKTHIAIFITNQTNADDRFDFSSYYGIKQDDFYLVIDGDTKIGNLKKVKLNESHPYFDLISGSGEDRKDNWSSNPFGFNIFNYSFPWFNNGRSTTNPSRKLEKILLFTLDREKILEEGIIQKGHYYVKDLVKVINFDQDYSLQLDQPNSEKDENTNSNYGKLTLNKLWFDYGGVFESTVSPYIFDYRYPTFTYQDEYDYLLDNYGTTLVQNPDFSRYNNNAWNKYQYDEDFTLNSGKGRKNDLLNSVDQTPPSNYDPAAWRLKRIVLPSQGEIHVQYETKDYSFVQNRKAQVLNRITAEVIDANEDVLYTLDLTDNYENGLTTDEIKLLAKELKLEHTSEVIDGIQGRNKKIYGKFLFNYTTDITPEISNCNAEYVDGFVDVSGIIVDDLNNPTSIKIKLDDKHFKSICLDKYKNTRIGMVPDHTSCNQNSEHSINEVDESILADMLDNINKVEWSISNSFCKTIKPSKSFFRIPLIRNKLAGGARTKRVLFYDKFNQEIELDDSQLYGYEYIYKDEYGKSSGVASNEPSQIGIENALVNILKAKEDQTFIDKFLAGEDRIQHYGPIGKNILPSPKITYSSIARKRIGIVNEENYNSSSDGFIIKKYITTKDYPFDTKYDLYNNSGGFVKGVNYSHVDNFEPFIPFIPTPIYNLDLGYYYATQGYMFVNSNLPGLLSSESHYNGDYFNKNTWSLKYSKKMNYTAPGECVPLFKGFNYSYEKRHNPFITENGIPGIEIESMSEAKTIDEESIVVNADFDLDFIFIPPFFIIPIPTAMPTLDINKRILKDYTTNTVVNFAPIVKSIEEYKDGINNVRENLVFDHKSGNPILTRDMDEFDGATVGGVEDYQGGIYNYSIPASYSYDSYNKKSELNYSLMGYNQYLIKDGKHHNESDSYLITIENSIRPLKEIFPQNTEIKLVLRSACWTGPAPRDYWYNTLFVTVIGATNNTILIKPSNKFGVIEGNSISLLDALNRTCEHNELKLSHMTNFNNNKINEISDYITVYGGTTSDIGCNFSIPNHFNTHFTSEYEVGNQDNQNISSDLNSMIQAKITSNNFNSEIADMSSYNVPYSDPLNGEELISDTSAVQFIMSIDSTIDQTLPLDSLEVNFTIKQKNTLSTSDSITNLKIVYDLNSLLNEQWNRNLLSYKNTQEWFNQCISSDTTGLFISDYYQGIIDSSLNESIVNNSVYRTITDSEYLMYNLDSNDNILIAGNEIIIDAGSTKSFISFRDLDSNYNIGTNNIGYTGKNSIKFINDTLLDYFDIGNLKYLKPNCNFTNIQSCFEEDCRDTLLKDIIEFASDWDTTFITLPGNSTISKKLYFPTNDSLFSFLEAYNSFTDNFGYFSVNQNGKLEYNTIDSSFGYNISSTTELFKIYELDSVVEYDHIEEHTFIVDPSLPITSFDLDTNKGGMMIIKPHPLSNESSTNSFLDFKGNMYPNIEVVNVLNARTVTFSKPTSNINEDKHSLPQSLILNEYVNYEKNILNYSTERDYNSTSYTSGLFDEFYMYFHRNPSRNSLKWRKLNSNERDQNNYMIESKSLNGIYSAILYNRIGLTSSVITNSDNKSFYFDSFEYPSSNQQSEILETAAHTGYNSIIIENDDYSLPFGNPEGMESTINMPLTDHLIEQGVLISLWLKIPKDHYSCYDQQQLNSPIDLTYTLDGQNNIFNFYKVTQTGDWSMFEFYLPSDVFNIYPATLPDELPVSIGLSENFECTDVEEEGYENEKVYIDDLLIRPYQSNTKCYVYNNKNDKLISILDENHFATYFQYNAKGDLIRKRKETYDGIKTIADAQYNTPKAQRVVPDPEDLPGGIYNSQFDIKTNHFQNYRVNPSEILKFKESQNDDTEVGAKFNMMDIKLNSDSTNIKFFDIKLNEGIIKDSLNFEKYNPNDSTVTPGLYKEDLNSKLPEIEHQLELTKSRFNQIKNDSIRINKFNQFEYDSLNRKVRK